MIRLLPTKYLIVFALIATSWPAPARKMAHCDIRSSTTAQDPEPLNPPGVPLGGIGCGAFYVLPDGRFANATINNNWEKPIERLPGCFAAVWARGGDVASAHVFSTKPEYGLPGSPGMQFDGYFPRAILRETDTRSPVTVTLRAYSSLVPQDLKNSSVPAAVFVFTVKNEAHAPVEAAVALSWENTLGVGGTGRKGAFSDRTGNTVEMLPASGGIFGIRMASPLRQTVDPPHRLIYNASGTYALLAAPSSPETEVTTAGWNTLDPAPGWWKSFSTEGTVSGITRTGSEGKVHPAGVVALKVSLKENETRELPFVVAWHTPRLYVLDGAEYGHYYEKSFDDAVDVGRYALDNRQTNLALLDEWQNRLLRSSLPGWFARQVMNDAAVLFTRTVFTNDSGMGGTDPGPFHFALLDDPNNVNQSLGSLRTRYLAHALLMAWYPQLDERELTDYVSRQHRSGSLAAKVWSVEEGLLPESQASESAPAPDAEVVASYTYQVLRRYRWTGDQKFLDRFYPSVKHAVENLSSLNAEPLDVSVAAVPETRVRDLSRARSKWMRYAAYKMAESLAGIMSDKRFQDRCKDWAHLSEVKVEETDAPLDIVRSTAAAAWMLHETDLADSVPARYAKWVRALTVGEPIKSPDGARLNVSPSAAAAFSTGEEFAVAPLVGAILAGGSGNPDLGLAWLNGLRVATAAPVTGPDAAQQLSSATWYMLDALLGFNADLYAGTLKLAPLLPAKAKSLVAPLFAPTFWASLEYRVSLTSARLTFRLERMMPANPAPKASKTAVPSGEPAAGNLILKEIVLPEPPGRTTMEVTASSVRAPVPGHFARRSEGHLVFTFASPLSLAVGQSLSFLMR